MRQDSIKILSFIIAEVHRLAFIALYNLAWILFSIEFASPLYKNVKIYLIMFGRTEFSNLCI